eukprot:jgi/Mesvir1/25451/Mv01722-RA.1
MEKSFDPWVRQQAYALVVAQLLRDGHRQAAVEVAESTMTPVSTSDIAPDRLLDLIVKGLAFEGSSSLAKPMAIAEGVSFTAAEEIRNPPELRSSNQGGARSRIFPSLASRVVSDTKTGCRCAAFSRDGQYVVTGNSDNSVRLLQVSKMKQRSKGGAPEPSDAAARASPVVRMFYDHVQPVNDLDFHPTAPIVISGADDMTVKFFDYAKASAKRAFRIVQDTHAVRSVSFHPSGDYFVAGTDHGIPHFYEVNSFQCFLPPNLQEQHQGGPINHVQFAPSGAMYSSCSRDGCVRLWDGVSGQCIRVINASTRGGTGAPVTTGGGKPPAVEALSATFSRNQKYLLTRTTDACVTLWDLGTGKMVVAYTGAGVCRRPAAQAIFGHEEEFILAVDEPQNQVVVWDTRTGELVDRIDAEHGATPPNVLAHSPSDPVFLTAADDRTIRFWQPREGWFLDGQ